MPQDRMGFYPSIVHSSGEPWTVLKCEPIAAAVNLTERIAQVPEALTEIDRAIQNHEYAHVKITDARVRDNSGFSKFQYYLEECRVNLWLARASIKYDIALDGFDWSKMPRPDNRLDCALQWLQVATYVLWRAKRPVDLELFMTDCQTGLLEAHQSGRAFNDITVLLNAVNAIKADQRKAVRDEYARYLDAHFAPPPPPEKPPTMKKEYEQERKEAKEAIERAEEREKDREKEPGKLKGGASSLGNMDIHRHITRAKPGRRIAQPFGSTDVGIIPTQFARRAIDGKVFKRQKATGAIIIDCSGSMSWDYGQLRQLIKTLPNLTIATYQGLIGQKGMVGRLCVIAEKGRWSEPQDEPGHTGGNEVDYEALEWGAKVTDGPVVWLSDGAVCGGVRSSGETTRLIDVLMRKRGIVRIRTSDDAVRYFGGKVVEVSRDTHGKQLSKRRMRK